MKACSFCQAPASIAYCVHLSTVGKSPRAQKLSRSVALCPQCCEQLIVSLSSSQPNLSQQFASSLLVLNDRAQSSDAQGESVDEA
jgi:hypothetical protein